MTGISSSTFLALLSWKGPQIWLDTLKFSMPPTSSNPLPPLGLYLCTPATSRVMEPGRRHLRVLPAGSGLLGQGITKVPLKVWPRRRGVGPWKVPPLGLQILCPVGRDASRERPELSSLKGWTQDEAPTTYSRLGTTTDLPRGLLASCVFFLPLKSFVGDPIKGVHGSCCPLTKTQLFHQVIHNLNPTSPLKPFPSHAQTFCDQEMGY